MPYQIRRNEKGEWCVHGPSGVHGCHETRADAIKQQRALYAAERRASAGSSDSEAIIPDNVETLPAPVRDISLLRAAVRRQQQRTDVEVTRALALAEGLSDPEVAAQTVALIGHLADRLKAAETNQATLVDVLQSVAADSAASRAALLEALQGISERLAEPTKVDVAMPDVNVSIAEPVTGEIEFERDSSGKLIGADVGNRSVRLKRDSHGQVVGGVVAEKNG